MASETTAETSNIQTSNTRTNDETSTATAHGPSDGRTTTESVGQAENWSVGSMKMCTVGDQKVAVARTESGFHAVDNACPHQGYGLVTGTLEGELITCQWHNWKFDVRTGACEMGEEDVACHPVDLVDGEVLVSVTSPTDEERRRQLWPSLDRGMESHYVGQIARDGIRLLETGVTPGEIMARGAEVSLSKTQYGIGHELAMAADCLAMAEVRHGTERALPLVQGLAGLSETTRGRPVREVPAPDASISIPQAIEAEDATGAMAGVLGAIEDGVDNETIKQQLIEAASAHHLSYGHGMIYTQKTFEFLDRVGWDVAPEVVPHLAASLVWSTREDTLPYMSKAMKQLATVDLDALAATEADPSWSPDEFTAQMLVAAEAPIDAAVAVAHDGAGIEGLLDAVSAGTAHRLLRHDLQVELDLADPFGWLDITHALTTAQAARWAWRTDPGPNTARAALFAVWLLFDAGRSERRHGTLHDHIGIDPYDVDLDANAPGDLVDALTRQAPDAAVAFAMTGERQSVGDALAAASLEDRAGSFIAAAHLVKTTEAARREAEVLNSPLPLAATARLLAAPRVERFVASNVAESVGFVTTGRPPDR